MNLHTEIRKLSPGDLYNLVQILEFDESWKKLMAVIPKTVNLEQFECKISINNLPKYNTDHFKLIDTAGYKQRRPCAEILLEEWGTSGRIRPRLGHLISLLKKTELYRAADYVAMKLLKMPEVDRPQTGPAAKVNIPQDEQLKNHIPYSTNYPSSILDGDAISTTVLSELMSPRPQHVIPTIIINTIDDDNSDETELPNICDDVKIQNTFHVNEIAQQDVEHAENITNNNIPAISVLLENKENEPVVETHNVGMTNEYGVNFTPDFSNLLYSQNIENSTNFTPDFSNILNSNIKNTNNSNFDMPDFSNIMGSNNNINNSQKLEYTPDFSNILNSNTNQNSDNIPDLSNIMLSNNVHNSQIATTSYTPNFSNIMNNNNNYNSQNSSSDGFTPDFSNILPTNANLNNENIPAFSQILTTDNSPAISEISSSEIPHFSELLSNNPEKNQQPPLDLPVLNDLLITSRAPSVNSTNSRTTCASPLPNLYLNTILPHFTYIELEQCTENFDETILSTQDSCNLNQAARFGRKLGSGAFGSVYLGIGLSENPVAVKKLNLNGVNVVNVDDTITKQFKNEVELLCKYKHENLLSLLGYSCDGPTYCLIYEYVCGGALKDRLQSSLKSPERFRLLWTDRLYIALGTAKAVSYLHNAYSMPLIHRDIKSANILLDNVNKPKLCDFGLIKLTPNPNTNTGTTVFGTSAYMAPEAFRGDVSVKLDTFSFGVVLLELLTSLPPLDENREGNDLVTHIEEVCENDIKPLLDTHAGSWVVGNTHIAEEIFEIANQCLEEKKRRPVMSVVVAKLSELIDKSVPT